MPHSDPTFLGFFADDVVEAYRLARSEAFRMGHPEIDSDHLLVGLVAQRHGAAADVLMFHGLSYNRLGELRAEVRERRPRRGEFDGMRLENVKPSREMMEVLEIAKLVARKQHPTKSDIYRADTAHVLYALALDSARSPGLRILLPQGHRPAQEVLLARSLSLQKIRIQALPGLSQNI